MIDMNIFITDPEPLQDEHALVSLILYETNQDRSIEIGTLIWMALQNIFRQNDTRCFLDHGGVVRRDIRNKLKVASGERPVVVTINTPLNQIDKVHNAIKRLSTHYGGVHV